MVGSARNQEKFERQMVWVNPHRCRMWEMHDRLTEYITEQSCALELENIRLHGQRSPVLGRRVLDDSSYDIELIYGARRLYVARMLECDLLVDVRQLSDHEAIIEMDAENRIRRDISPYERAMSYKALLTRGLFKAQRDLASGLGLSQARLSRLLKFCELPTVVITAFASPLEIKESWAVTLANRMKDPRCRDQIIRVARSIQKREFHGSAEDVFTTLLSAADARRSTNQVGRDRVIRAVDGTILFRISPRRKSVHIVVPEARTAGRPLSHFIEALTHLLEGNGEISPRGNQD